MKGLSKQLGAIVFVLLATAVLGVADTGNMPPPGTLNYVEGQVRVQGEKQTPTSVGSTYLEAGQNLQTHDGNAEMLLTPGVFLRLGHNSEVKMLSPNLTNTKVQLLTGSAMVEVDELFKQNNLSVVRDNTTTRIEKAGVYDFTANPASVKVLDGKAETLEGDRRFTIKKGHENLLAEGQLPVRRKFDKKVVEAEPLYRWSLLRSEYASEANVNAGNALVADGGWWGPGWYWDPFWMDFAFMPGWGIGWGPFGYPFFSPWYVGWAPYYGFYGYGGFGGYYHNPGARGRLTRPVPRLAHGPMRGSAGFRALPRGMAMGRMGAPMGGIRGRGFAGGFRGASPGFHGGGFAGGFHGGFGGRR